MENSLLKMKIYQIEITNICNLKCSYCPRHLMKRKQGIMSMKTLKHIMDKIENNTLRLQHYGESLIDNNIVEKIKYIKKRKPKMNLIINTNGTLITNKIVRELFSAGLTHIIISYHVKESISKLDKISKKYRKNIEVIILENNENINKLKELGYKVTIKKLRDLGIIKKNKIFTNNVKERCAFIKYNEVVIEWNGDIVPCCEVYDNHPLLGNIENDLKIKNKPFNMCKYCEGYGNDYSETELKT